MFLKKYKSSADIHVRYENSGSKDPLYILALFMFFYHVIRDIGMQISEIVCRTFKTPYPG